MAVVSQSTLSYGAEVRVAIGAQVVPSAEYSYVADEMPDAYPLCAGSFSAEVRCTVPRTFRPGSCMVAAGAPVSRCHDQVAGVGSVFPAMSVARTSTVWRPSVRPLNVFGLVDAFHAPPSMRHPDVEP